jgi:CubicO group peptidase (beta-lactamase class C family)
LSPPGGEGSLRASSLVERFSSQEYADLRSVIVRAHGRTAYERYYKSAATDYHRGFAVTESVISALIGIAIGEGAISSVDATLGELLPDYAGEMTTAAAATTLARLLTLDGGAWEGHQVVPADWVHQATTKQADDGYGGYGYLWWVGQLDDDPLYLAAGNGGQRIFVIPNRELVDVYQVWTDPAVGNHEQSVAGELDDAFSSVIAPAYKA